MLIIFVFLGLVKNLGVFKESWFRRKFVNLFNFKIISFLLNDFHLLFLKVSSCIYLTVSSCIYLCKCLHRYLMLCLKMFTSWSHGTPNSLVRSDNQLGFSRYVELKLRSNFRFARSMKAKGTDYQTSVMKLTLKFIFIPLLHFYL